MKGKYSINVTKSKMKKIGVVYLVQIFAALLPTYLNGATIASATKDVTQILNSKKYSKHMIKLTPNKGIKES